MLAPVIQLVEKLGPDGRLFKAWWECSSCHGEVKIKFLFCPHCGEKFFKEEDDG